jgi:cell shape-determining protein MreD
VIKIFLLGLLADVWLGRYLGVTPIFYLVSFFILSFLQAKFQLHKVILIILGACLVLVSLKF